jgi:hypothetical protein
MRLSLALLCAAVAVPTSFSASCLDYGNDIICAGGHCFECHEDFCSSDDAQPQPPNCGSDLAEPNLATSCDDSMAGCARAAAAACNAQAGCNSFSLDPGWSLSATKLFGNSGAGLVANNDWNTWVRTNKTAPPAPAPSPPGTCHTDLDCSLNGVCTDHKCACDKPWSGEACEFLNFAPVSFPQGYGMTPNTTSWGGNIIFEPATKLYHMFVSRMTNNCSLSYWTSNSRIDHAVSSSVEGPYEFKDVAVNTWAHNAAPITLPDGTYAIVHIGTGEGGPDGGSNCTVGADPTAAAPTASASSSSSSSKTKTKTQGGSTIHVAKSLNGPWEPLQHDLGDCNNPAPWVHPNGTIYVGCGGDLRSAQNIAGPYTTAAHFPFGGGPPGNYEDPQVYTDARGNFHCLYHVYTTNLPSFNCVNSTVSAHAFSPDGSTWRMSHVSPYGTQVSPACLALSCLPLRGPFGARRIAGGGHRAVGAGAGAGAGGGVGGWPRRRWWLR